MHISARVSSCTCVVESVPFQETTENISPRPCSASCSFVLFTSWNEPSSPSQSSGSRGTTSAIFHGFFYLVFSITNIIRCMCISNSRPSPGIAVILERCLHEYQHFSFAAFFPSPSSFDGNQQAHLQFLGPMRSAGLMKLGV